MSALTGKKPAFTLIELTIVILILGILLVSGVAKIINLAADAKAAAENDSVAVVRSGLNTYPMAAIAKGMDESYPVSLDNSPGGTYAAADNQFFINVINPPGITDSGWYKANNSVYRAPSGTTYIYNSANGSFLTQQP